MRPTDLRGILQYVPQFRERVFVIAMDGAVVLDENFSNLLLDIAVLRSLNIRVVLAHGAGALIKTEAERLGVAVTNLDGTGVADAATFGLAVAAANRLNHEILQGLAAIDQRAARPTGVDASPLGIIKGVDHLHTGKVEKVDVELLNALLGSGVVPVIPPLGCDGEGRTYRINSDAVAAAVAKDLKAAKLIFITNRDGLLCQQKLVRQINAGELDKALTQRPQDFEPEQTSKAVHAALACKGGVPRVHVINGFVDEGLLAEIFSNEGIGTLVYANEYAAIRPARKADIRTLRRITRSAVVNDELLKRTRAAMEKDIADYFLYEIDHNPVGCVALHVYPEARKGELAFLFVTPTHEHQGIGRKLIQYVEARARELGLQQMFTLSTQAFNYLRTKGGFVEGTPGDLPGPRRERYEQSGRNSKVLTKNLAA